MIRVNLASAQASSFSLGAGGEEGGGGFSNEKEMRKSALTKLFLIFMIPLALYFYEQQNVPTIRAQLAQKQNQLNELQAFNAKAQSAVNEIKKFKEDEKKIQTRIDALEKISKNRFREVKVLDLFQQVTPEKLWFTRLDVKDTKILLNGYSMSDYDISAFMEALSKSVFLQDVVLISSSEVVLDGMSLKKFEVSCVLDQPESEE